VSTQSFSTFRELEKSLRNAIAAHFADLGMRRQRGLLTYPANDSAEVIGLIGLNLASHKIARQLEVNVVIGVSHRRIENFLADLLTREAPDMKSRTEIAFTASRPLSYLMPAQEYHPFYFSLEGGCESTMAQMNEAIRKYGCAFVRENVNLKDLAATLEAGGGHLHQVMFRLPIVYALLGENERAQRYVRDQVDKLGAETYPHAQLYRRFAQQFEQTLSP
jgi:hypothetical protein